MTAFHDRVKETTTTTGTGNITLDGTSSTYKTFTSRYAVGEKLYYALVHRTADEWETGYGALVNSTTFARVKVQESSNSDAVVNFSSGTKDIFSSFISDRANECITRGRAQTAVNKQQLL